MKKVLPLLLVLAFVAAGLQAAPKKKRSSKKAPVKPTEKFSDDSIMMVECKAKPEYHYRVYLPKGYNAEENKARKYPMLLVSNAGGNANMKPMDKWIRANQWIVVMLVEAKNGPWEPILGNFAAAMNDSFHRFRIHSQMVVVTGVSGGARACGRYTTMSKSISATIYCAAVGMGRKGILVGCSMGLHDFNFAELRRAIKGVPASDLNIQMQDGGHGWGTADGYRRHLDWIQEKFYLAFSIAPETAEKLYAMFEARYEGAETPYAKYLIRDFQKRFITKQRLNKSKEQKARYRTVSKELLALKRDKSVKKETLAVAALRKMQPKVADLLYDVPTQDRQKAARKMMLKNPPPPGAMSPPGAKAASPEREKKVLGQIKKAYEAFCKKYADTKVAAIAQVELDMILKGYEK